MARRERRPSLKGTVSIEFWTDYADLFKEVAAAIEAAYPHVQVLGNLDQPRKAAFEIVSQTSGRIYHSKVKTGRLPVPREVVAALRDEFEFIEPPAEEPLHAAGATAQSIP